MKIFQALKDLHVLRGKGSNYPDGRISVHTEDYRRKVSLAWHVLDPNPMIGLGFEVGVMEEGFDLDIGVGLARIHLSLEGHGIVPRWLAAHVERRKYRYALEWACRLQWFQDEDACLDPIRLRWNLGLDPDSSDRADPKWRRGSLSLFDVLFGKGTHQRESEVVGKNVEIPLPEGPVPAKITLTKHVWRRPRLPRPQRHTTFEVDFKPKFVSTGHPKRDGLFAMSIPARSIDDGIGQIVGRIISERLSNALRPDGTSLNTPRTAIELVAAERRTHADKGWTPEHDDLHAAGELIKAALYWLKPGDFAWPWGNPPESHKNERGRVRHLVIAASFILAEIDRLIRAEAKKTTSTL